MTDDKQFGGDRVAGARARDSLVDARLAADPLYWEDCCDYTYAAASIARGGGNWPSMVSVEWPEEGTYTADDLRSLAQMLIRAADTCDESTREVYGD